MISARATDVSQTQAIPAFCTQCRSRCGCLARVADGRLVGIEPLPGHPSGAKLCPKGKAAPELVYHPDRLTHPLKRTAPKGAADPGWVRIGWDEALDHIADQLATIAATHGAEQVAFAVTTPSGTHVSDGIAWIERLIHAFGSPNTIYGTEICNWHKDHATRFTFGHDIGTPDFAHAGCILLWGNDPTTTWLARAEEVRRAVRRGAKLVVVDPRPTAFARRADAWLQVNPGTDQALALGLAHLLIRDGRFAQGFVEEWTNGPLLVRDDTGRLLRARDLDPAAADHLHLAVAETGGIVRYDAVRGAWPEGRPALRLDARIDVQGPAGTIACRTAFAGYAEAAAAWPPERVAAVTGVDPASLEQAAVLLAQAGPVAYHAWSGVAQSATATQTDRAIALLHTLTGSYGDRGGNVPGAAASFASLAGDELMPAAQRAKALGLDRRPLGPGRNGWVTARDVYRAILEGEPYPIRALVGFGSNLLASQPDSERAEAALARLPFYVHADFFLHPTAAFADIVLPVATSWEREGLRTGFDASLEGLRRVQLRPPVVAPVGEARSDTDIVLGLARRLGLNDRFFDGDADRGHDSVLAPAGLDVAALRLTPEGIDLPGKVPLRAFAAPAADGAPTGFPTPSRRIEIHVERFLAHGQAPVPVLDAPPLAVPPEGFPLRLTCAKTLAYCHSQHRNLASLRRLVPDPVVELSPGLAVARGLAEGQWLRLATPSGAVVARTRLVRTLADDVVVGQHGWWLAGPPGSPYAEPGSANLNRVMASDQEDPISGSIPLRGTWCEIEALPGPA
jgi:anaerobic selenocysteine-containing dehydrogenase